MTIPAEPEGLPLPPMTAVYQHDSKDNLSGVRVYEIEIGRQNDKTIDRVKVFLESIGATGIEVLQEATLTDEPGRVSIIAEMTDDQLGLLQKMTLAHDLASFPITNRVRKTASAMQGFRYALGLGAAELIDYEPSMSSEYISKLFSFIQEENLDDRLKTAATGLLFAVAVDYPKHMDIIVETEQALNMSTEVKGVTLRDPQHPDITVYTPIGKVVGAIGSATCHEQLLPAAEYQHRSDHSFLTNARGERLPVIETDRQR